MPTKLDVVNQALNELGQVPVTAITDQPASIIIANKLDVLLPEMLLTTEWNWALKFVQDNTPNTVNLTPDFPYNYTLPPDYGRMCNISWQTINFGLYYRIMDNVIMTNSKPLLYYYVVNNVDYSVIPAIFYRALSLYAAATACDAITNNDSLSKKLQAKYERKLSDAIRQNDMDRYIASTPYNDFDRQTYV
jgi:hypothetical protein